LKFWIGSGEKKEGSPPGILDRVGKEKKNEVMNSRSTTP